MNLWELNFCRVRFRISVTHPKVKNPSANPIPKKRFPRPRISDLQSSAWSVSEFKALSSHWSWRRLRNSSRAGMQACNKTWPKSGVEQAAGLPSSIPELLKNLDPRRRSQSKRTTSWLTAISSKRKKSPWRIISHGSTWSRKSGAQRKKFRIRW